MSLNTDPIADMLARIRNALMVRNKIVIIPSSSLKIEILKILKEEGYIDNFDVINRKVEKVVKVDLRYDENMYPVIRGLKRVSKPSLRKYAGYQNMPHVHGGMSVTIMSTPGGVMTAKTAKSRSLGGEVLCYVW
jgi:small subunit ribosomal protein S8